MSPTRYTVVSSDAADDVLVSLWLNYPKDRKAITRASHVLQSALRYDPEPQGSPAGPKHPPGTLTLDRLPLRVLYEVSEPDRIVRLVDWEYLPAIP
jgi:hypothetical protein